MAINLAAQALLLNLVVWSYATTYIIPGGPTTPHWRDTDGNRIEAHAAGMLYDDKTSKWYWYGESKKTSDLSTHGVNCYSSPSLTGPWTNEGQVMAQSQLSIRGESGPFVVERPKVIYNSDTQLYVMWFHLDDSGYKYRHAGVATSSIPNKPFKFLYALQPDGIPSLDMSLWVDPLDHQAYFVRSCDNSYVGISRLTSDYLNTTGIISTHDKFEGMAFFRLDNGTYYIVTSHLTGWNPNPLMLFRAGNESLDFPDWQDMGNPTNDPTSFDTQPTYVVQAFDANNKPYYIYMADNWVHGGPNGLIDASYVWLPFRFEPNAITLQWQYAWDPLHPFDPPPASVCMPPNNGTTLAFGNCSLHQDYATWMFPASQGPIKLQSDPALCVAPVEGIAQNGASRLGLQACNGSPDQEFTLHADKGTITSNDGRCVDVTYCGNAPCDGNPLELYPCNSAHHNEEFAITNNQWTWQASGSAPKLCALGCELILPPAAPPVQRQ